MHQDQQLINNLIEQQNTSNYDEDFSGPLQDSPTENQMTISRVVTAKYKVYVIFLLILLLIGAVNIAPKTRNSFLSANTSFNESRDKLANLEQEILHIQEKKAIRSQTESQQNLIISCINEKSGCDQLDEKIKSTLSTARSYLQLGTLGSEKMQINEKKILKNLDQYLIRQKPSENSSPRNGEILSIEIGSGSLIDPQSGFSQIPIIVKVIFNNKDDLVSFVNNIEQYIIDNAEDRILYHIEEVSYDMMAYDESQETELKLTAYYFK